MAGYLTTYGANTLLDGDSMPTTLYAQGHIGDPGVNAILDVAGESRRMALVWETAVAGEIWNSNVGTILGATSSEDWTHLTLWDAAAAGNPWWIIPLVAPLSIVLGGTIRIAMGIVTISFELWS